jgi:DnaK suppressor protein
MTTRKTENDDRERYLLLRGMLEDRRREIHEKLRSLREAIPAASHDVRDAEEQSVDEFVQEVDLALMQMKSETLKKIDAAILRLEQGSYGRCQECDQEIAAARLRALPFAVLCRDCQEQAEDRVRYEREAKAFARLQKELASVTLRTGNARD